MSDIIELRRLRGAQADKDASTRVLPEGQTAVVLDEAYHVLGDGVTELKDLRPMEDRRIDTVDATSGPLVMTDVSPSIIAADTSGGTAEIDLPDLASNQGRKIYVLNINEDDSIEITAQSGDGIGADGDESVTVDQTITKTLLIGMPSYWALDTGGGGGGGGEMPAGFIAPFAADSTPSGWLSCDGTAVSRTVYDSLFTAIGTTWGVGDGSTTFNLPDLRGAFLRGTGSHGSETMADGNPFAGPAVGATEGDQMQGFHAEIGVSTAGTDQPDGDFIGDVVGRNSPSREYKAIQNLVSDGTNGDPRTGDETRPFAAGIHYCIKT